MGENGGQTPGATACRCDLVCVRQAANSQEKVKKAKGRLSECGHPASGLWLQACVRRGPPQNCLQMLRVSSRRNLKMTRLLIFHECRLI